MWVNGLWYRLGSVRPVRAAATRSTSRYLRDVAWVPEVLGR
jgi:hypothetical protein